MAVSGDAGARWQLEGTLSQAGCAGEETPRRRGMARSVRAQASSWRKTAEEADQDLAAYANKKAMRIYEKDTP